jgi:penicillin amidase
MIPFDEIPHVENPDDGIFVTANTAPPGHEENSHLGIEWLDPYRRDSIREALLQRKDWSVADCQKLQLDYRSLPWREMRDAILRAAESREKLRDVSQLLRSWDGVLGADSRAAGLFELFAAEMMVKLALVRAPGSHTWFLGETAWMPGINLFYLRRMGPLSKLLREQPEGWFDRPWTEVMADALEVALARSSGRTWGEMHTLRPKSLLFGDIWPLSHVFSTGPIPVGGDTDTINQASIRQLNPIGETDNIPGMRMVVDVGNWSASRFVIAGGQSSNPLSPHYDDMFPLWQRGEGVPMPWTPDEVRASAREKLILVHDKATR